uniref:Choline/ethanolamine phosphotransferase 3 n=1 Tax=Eimeria falciformis TaxID=84963 RepID=A0A221S612_9EIME|nr:choline/ethanolamine phosphotransferase 3 [Eimeria falciformis]
MTEFYCEGPEAALHYSPRLWGLGFNKLWGFCFFSGFQQVRKAADTPQLQIHPSYRYTPAPPTPQLMASPVAAAPQGRSNTNSTKSSSSNKSSQKKIQTSASSPSGTVFYQWIVSPLCDRICSKIPPWVHPDIISFLGLCCTSASAYCCCAATNDSSGSQLALAALLWVLYGLLDNIDGKQARRLGLCSAGGDFFDHSSDSVSSSFAALLILHMLCNKVAPSAAAAAAASTAETLNIHPTAFHVCFVLLSQAPFFIATWAHPIVGRTMLSASIDSTSNFSVDELNLLLIPGLLLLKAHSSSSSSSSSS